jgi:hypothetical protein
MAWDLTASSVPVMRKMLPELDLIKEEGGAMGTV